MLHSLLLKHCQEKIAPGFPPYHFAEHITLAKIICSSILFAGFDSDISIIFRVRVAVHYICIYILLLFHFYHFIKGLCAPFQYRYRYLRYDDMYYTIIHLPPPLQNISLSQSSHFFHLILLLSSLSSLRVSYWPRRCWWAFFSLQSGITFLLPHWFSALFINSICFPFDYFSIVDIAALNFSRFPHLLIRGCYFWLHAVYNANISMGRLVYITPTTYHFLSMLVFKFHDAVRHILIVHRSLSLTYYRWRRLHHAPSLLSSCAWHFLILPYSLILAKFQPYVAPSWVSLMMLPIDFIDYHDLISLIYYA